MNNFFNEIRLTVFKGSTIDRCVKEAVEIMQATNYSLGAIKFDFNGIAIEIKKTTTVDEGVRQYWAGVEKLGESK